jgi:hypothetical protein
MKSTGLDKAAWRAFCRNVEVSCSDRALSPMHALFLFSQSIDDELQRLDAECVEQAFEIARDYGYESSLDRASFVKWLSTETQRNACQGTGNTARPGAQL